MDGRTSATVVAATWAIAVLVVTASVLGLVDPGVYAAETDNWAAQARGQDIGNLVAFVLLVASGHRWVRGSHRAAIVWLGALLYLVYAYVIYAMAVHFNHLFLVYVAVLGLSSWAVLLTTNRVRAHDVRVRARVGAGVPKWPAVVAVAIGVLFALMWLAEVVPASVSGEPPQSVVEAGLCVNPVHVIDLAILLPAFVAAGWLALRGRASGQFFVGPLLVFSVLMGSSIVAAMVLMTAEGFSGTVPTMVMVSLVVLASLVAAGRHLASYVEVSEVSDPGHATRPWSPRATW